MLGRVTANRRLSRGVGRRIGEDKPVSGAGEEQEGRFSISQRLQQHMVRLHTVVEMGVIGEPPAEQARRILADSTTALDFDYGELGEEREGEESGYARLCAVGDGASKLQTGIGWRGVQRDRAAVIFDTLQDEIAQDHAVAALGLRSLLFWPFVAEGKRCVLTLGWKQPRQEFIGEEEIQYLNFLAALVSRLLEALERQRRIAERADTDVLTGIPNRAAVLDHLTRALSAAQREDLRVALLYVDLNHFKRMNDEHGHSVGDIALRDIALRIQGVLRRHEMCGRFGGDEFCVVVSSFKEDDELAVIAKRVLDAIAEPVTVDETLTLNASASIGIAVYPRDGTTASEMLSRADAAMYRAKRAGTAAFAFCDASVPTTVERPVELGTVNFHSQFVLCYQPIVAARNGRPVAAEVLPRWLHPQGMRSPETLLRAAQAQGLLGEFDPLILRAVLDRLTEIRNIADLWLHVNVAEPSEALIEALPRETAPLAFELSEAQVAAEPYRYVAFASACRARGLRVGLSQFGSGDLSLRTLTELRPDFVKLVGAVHGQPGALKMMIDQAHHLGASVIGEAVETPSERQWLAANGADALQGFEICSPLAEQDFAAWLRRYR